MKATKGNFSLDASDSFQGYTLGQSWNGFACPYFTLTEAKRIADSVSCPNDGFTLTYDDRSAKFILDSYGEVETIEPCILDTVDGGFIVYPIGLSSWCWWDESND